MDSSRVAVGHRAPEYRCRTRMRSLIAFSVMSAVRLLTGCTLIAFTCVGNAPAQPQNSPGGNSLRYFGIRIIDEETEIGVPLVEIRTVDDVVWMTDSAGYIAISEPELEGQAVFFQIRSPGYQMKKDGFGMEGMSLTVRAGETETIRIRRTQNAERIYRITGRDRYRDSERLAVSPLPSETQPPGKVVGQDSVQTAVYRDRLYWFWGDTNQLRYPLGLFRTAGAISDIPPGGHPDSLTPIPLQYFVAENGFARAMVDVPEKEGVVWIHGLCVVPDQDGQERMVAQYSRRRGLSEPLEQGLLVWDDNSQIFRVLRIISLDESWRILRDHPLKHTESGVDYLMFGNPFPVTRVPATFEAIQDPEAYESWTCRDAPGASGESGRASQPESFSLSRPVRDADGRLNWRWQKAPPVTQEDEHNWVRKGLIRPNEARFLPWDADHDGQQVVMHSGTVFWNSFRQRWVMIAVEHGLHRRTPSLLGEVFYSESVSPQGPFRLAKKIAAHPGQSFYNPCHQVTLDRDGGRTIFFEGTYCNTFTSSPATPRYNYNQLMYRLRLDQSALTELFDHSDHQSP